MCLLSALPIIHIPSSAVSRVCALPYCVKHKLSVTRRPARPLLDTHTAPLLYFPLLSAKLSPPTPPFSPPLPQITDGRRVVVVSNGVPMLTLVTAAGCSVTALIAAFVAVAPQEPLLATAHALAGFG